MLINFFDTETNGKAIDFKAPMTNLKNWPRVTQLAWQIADIHTGNLLIERSYMVKPDGWTIPKEEFFIKNNMSTERSMAEGIPLEEVLDHYVTDARQCDAMAAHNMDFDYPVLGAEMIRTGKKVGHRLVQYCTMKIGTPVAKLPSKYRNSRDPYKWPSLDELYKHLFGQPYDRPLHDAGIDVTMCRLCFFKMAELGHITMPEPLMLDSLLLSQPKK